MCTVALPSHATKAGYRKGTRACNCCLCVFKCCLRSILMQPTGRPELEV
jgi:hypothetical protein